MQEAELPLLVLMVAVGGLSVLAGLVGVPYPILLVLGGLVLGFVPGLPVASLPPDLVLVLFLPPLLSSTAFFSSPRDLLSDLRAISLLAVGLVLVTMGAVAVIAHTLVSGLPWAAAFTLGAIVSPTDPLAATAIAHRLGVPRRLVTVLEGESLVNDATALVAYRLALAAVVAGGFSLWEVLPARGRARSGLAAGGACGPTAARGCCLEDVQEGGAMGIVSRGFRGRRGRGGPELPPGQYLVKDFPVLSAGPTPRIDLDDWEFVVTNETGERHRWDWAAFRALPTEEVTVDIHCVTKWSKLGTTWEGVSLDTLMGEVETSASFALVESYGGYTSNLPLEDLLDGKAWIAFRYDGEDLEPEHGGPARMLVPHLYLWKSAKWVRGIKLLDADEPGFWESLGYHNYGDPWREQRYWGD